MLHQHTTLNCNGHLIDLSQPLVMGILNVTPDSFYDGGKYEGIDNRLLLVEKMIKEGATFIDIGGMSSRPGAELISQDEELSRVIPTIEAINQRFPETVISIDTVWSRVAKESVEAGASMINDISAGGYDDQLFATVASLRVPYVLMHMQGDPKSMQNRPEYKDVNLEVLDFFIEKVGELRSLEIIDIILDPGFGFGKTVEHNYQMLKDLHVFQILGLPLLAGISRKSMLCKVLKINPSNALNGTTALHMIALQQGAKILRVHDVKEAKECIQLWQQLEEV